MNNEDKKTTLENTIFNKIMLLDDEPEFATVQELNVEASTRADNDQIICDKYDLKFGEIDGKFAEDEGKIDILGEKVTVAEGNIKTNDGRITALEEGIWDQIRRLEEEKQELVTELEEANVIISEKDEEIKKLQDELASGNGNEIDFKFPSPPEYSITELMTVKDFINKNLKDLVIPKMDLLYPETTFGKDYTIIIHGLNYNDIMQGKMVPICVKALGEGKLVGECDFDIKVTYNYNLEQQQRFVEELLQPAIPTSLRNIPENMSPNYNVQTEIAKTRPLKLLLNNRDYKHFVFKIFGEMNSGSYWTDFHRPWQFNRNGYDGTGQSNIGGAKDQVINNIKGLYNNTVGYHNSIYKFIERLINDSGVPCTITKKWGKSSNGDLLHNVGNLVFDVPSGNLDNNDIVMTQSRDYYMMINFEISINNEVKKFYRGVTLALTDNLELYPTVPTK